MHIKFELCIHNLDDWYQVLHGKLSLLISLGLQMAAHWETNRMQSWRCGSRCTTDGPAGVTSCSHAGGTRSASPMQKQHVDRTRAERSQGARPCRLPLEQDGRTPGQRMCCPPNPTRTHHPFAKREALGVTDQTPEGSTKAKPKSLHSGPWLRDRHCLC